MMLARYAVKIMFFGTTDGGKNWDTELYDAEKVNLFKIKRRIEMKKRILKYFIFFLFCIFSFSATIYSQWTQQTNGLQFWKQGNAIDACDSNTAIIVVDSILYKTEDAGNSWIKVIYPIIQWYGWGTDVSIIDSNHFWISTGSGGILATSDGGTNWSVQFYDTTKTRFMDYVKMFDINNGIAIGDAVGNNPFLLLTTSDGGNNWFSVNEIMTR